MAGEDLIGPKQSPNGGIVGLFVRAGDSFHVLGNGPVVTVLDPITHETRYFRLNVQLTDNGDGTTTPTPILEEVSLT